MDAFPGSPEQAQHLGWPVAVATEPVRLRRVELDRLTDTEGEVLLTQDQAHPAGEHVEPLIAVVRAQLWRGLRDRDQDLPCLDAARACQRQNRSPLHPSGLEADPGITDVRSADQVVQRHPVGLSEWEEQLEGGSPLPVLQPRQRGLGDAGALGELDEGDRPVGPDLPEARTHLVQGSSDGVGDGIRRVAHSPIGAAFPRIGNILCCAVSSARILRDMSNYDVVVVGGGAAGLSAALVLSRARRKVLVLDAGDPRNAPAAHMQGYLSRDGMPPAELLAHGRDEVRNYGGRVVTGTVEGISACHKGGFRVIFSGGHQVTTRQVLLATGLRDELPHIEGLRERWARDVLHCPYCHGHEVLDQRLGVIAITPDAVRYAQIVRQWSHDVVVFAPEGMLTETQRTEMVARAIGIVEGTIARVLTSDDDLSGVEMDDGRVIPREVLFVPPRFVPNNDLLVKLGADLDANGWVRTDATGATSVPGLWVAGNLANPRAQVITAAGEGSAAAISMNAALVDDDVRRAVQDFHHAAPSND